MMVSQTYLLHVCVLYSFCLLEKQDSIQEVRFPLWETTCPLVPAQADHRGFIWNINNTLTHWRPHLPVSTKVRYISLLSVLMYISLFSLRKHNYFILALIYVPKTCTQNS